MRRRLFNILAAFSMLLFLATVALWVRGHWRHDAICVTWARRYAIVSEYGVIQIDIGYHLEGATHTTLAIVPIQRTPTFEYRSLPPESSGEGISQLPAFGQCPDWLEEGPASAGGRWLKQGWRWFLILPNWFLLICLACIPAMNVCLGLRRRRVDAQCACATCGYDLRASKERCPECGTQITRGMVNNPVIRASNDRTSTIPPYAKGDGT